MPRQGMGRGRRRGQRWVGAMPPVTNFGPIGRGQGRGRTVILTIEEVETLRLVDLEGLQQQEAAERMGVSRRSLWNDLKTARRKVAQALVNGWAITIQGGNYILRTGD